MYQKTVQKEVYPEEKLERLNVLFEELKKFRKSPSVRAYVRKRQAELKG